MTEKSRRRVLLPLGEGGAKRRMRANPPHDFVDLQNRGAGLPSPAASRHPLPAGEGFHFVMRTLWLPILIVLIVSPVGAQSLQPAGWDSQIKLRDAVDLNPDPHIVEVNIEAKLKRVELEPGREVEAWTYNSDIPGPLIRIHTGDRLIVHFTNHLPQPSTIHWHGVRLGIQMDGVPGHSQPEVKPGESFTYDFIVPDAGLFWYHPHVESAMQVGYGLYGALLVEDDTEQVGVSDELVLVLSDIALEDNGTLQSPENSGPVAKVFGLEGNHVLVNGREHSRLVARSGAPQRWRIVNAAKSKYFQLDLNDPATDMPFTIIGGDGGLQEYPTPQQTLVIAPGERIDAIVKSHAKPGTELTVQTLPFNRGYGSEYLPIADLFTMAIADNPEYSSKTETAVHREIKPLDTANATAVDVSITLVQSDPRNIEYRLNGVPLSHMQPIPAKVGETQIWTITNKTDWSHPVHLHGFFFQVLDKDGQPAHPLAWKDTVDVPFKETLRFIVRYDDRPGASPAMWMFHCHVLDHAEGGLMTMVELTRDSSPHSNHVHSDH
jgi:FtsP/CotA-like multicopper oxidase with cupredoxin domain